jgi:hypothetical protein
MVAGDVVNGIGLASATWYYFQPAAANECLIASIQGGTLNAGLYDGVTNNAAAYSGNDNTINLKFFINNTNYLAYYGQGGALVGYSGLQIK